MTSAPEPFALWNHLPEPVLDLLLRGSSGKLHLLKVADLSLGLAAQAEGARARDLIRLGFESLLAGWESDLLDGGMAGYLVNLAGRLPWLPEELRATARAVAEAWREPGNLGYYERLLERGDPDRLWSYLHSQLDKDPGNFFWVRLGLERALALGESQRAQAFLDVPSLAGLAGMRDRLAGELRLLAGDVEAALAMLRRSARELPLPGTALLTAEALLRLGSRDQALDMFLSAARAAPWRTNLLLKAYDLASGADTDTAALPGGVSVLLYTYNKARDLDATLEALFASRMDEALVLVLDNGSSDDTPHVLAGWKGRGGERLEIITLPVNVGAPAARNWLLHHQALDARPYVAYLDDDALVPEDWLMRLGAAVKRYPEAGVWGCRVVDAQTPALLQSTDIHIEVVPEGQRTPIRHFHTSSLHLDDLDRGQYAYMRPCASVTGCCHLFDLARLRRVGNFDLWFSPSQLDDLDRDLRMAEQGGYAVYQGHLAVRHAKRSGKGVWASANQWGNSQGNEVKLQLKYLPEDIKKIIGAVRDRMWRDLASKLGSLAEGGI